MSTIQAWRWVLNAVQDNGSSTVNILEMAPNPDPELEAVENAPIQDNTTVHGAVAYFHTDTTTPVQSVGEMSQRKVGRTTFEIAEKAE